MCSARRVRSGRERRADRHSDACTRGVASGRPDTMAPVLSESSPSLRPGTLLRTSPLERPVPRPDSPDDASDRGDGHPVPARDGAEARALLHAPEDVPLARRPLGRSQLRPGLEIRARAWVSPGRRLARALGGALPLLPEPERQPHDVADRHGRQPGAPSQDSLGNALPKASRDQSVPVGDPRAPLRARLRPPHPAYGEADHALGRPFRPQISAIRTPSR